MIIYIDGFEIELRFGHKYGAKSVNIEHELLTEEEGLRLGNALLFADRLC